MKMAILGACAKELVIPAGLTGAGSKPNTGISQEESFEQLISGVIALDWGLSQFLPKGLLFSGIYGFTEPTDRMNFCFENNSPCVRASSAVREGAGGNPPGIGNNPVLVQAFQLNMISTATNTFTLQAASVTTAEIQFNSSDGRLVFANRHTRQLVDGQTCSLETVNPQQPNYAVGFDPGTPGAERALTGLYLYDEGIENVEGTMFNTVYMTSARVWYSGLVPIANSSSTQPFGFGFNPVTQPEIADFGKDTFVDTATTGIAVSPKFGLDPTYAVQNNIERPNNHVVIGFCIQSQKSGSVPRPGFLGSKVRTYRPRLFLRETSN